MVEGTTQNLSDTGCATKKNGSGTC